MRRNNRSRRLPKLKGMISKKAANSQLVKIAEKEDPIHEMDKGDFCQILPLPLDECS